MDEPDNRREYGYPETGPLEVALVLAVGVLMVLCAGAVLWRMIQWLVGGP